ncbi:MAG TPA: zinc-binding dehydrogenase [Opitutaceae bacterium]|nr:zinc-binding dehydrogenase [Opitutaceae bacterium]
MNTTTMWQLQLDAPRTPVWREAAVPVPGEDEVLVRVLGVTTCPHWELHMFDGVPMHSGHEIRYPLPAGHPGHEAMGEVAGLGPGVTEFAVGDRVVAWRSNLHASDGFYRQFNAYPAELLLKIPRELTPAAVASLELAMCVESSFAQLATVGGVAGRRVGVAGLGPGGLVAVQLARAHGAKAVVGIDPVAARRALALKLGADDAVAPDSESWPASRDDAKAIDMAMDCTGRSEAVEFLLARTRIAVALFGVLREPVRYSPELMWGPGVSLLGYGDHTRAHGEAALGFVAAGKLRLDVLVTCTMPMRRYADAVEMLRRHDAIKVLLDPWG